VADYTVTRSSPTVARTAPIISVENWGYGSRTPYEATPLHDSLASFPEPAYQNYSSLPKVMPTVSPSMMHSDGAVKMVGLGLSLARSSVGKTTYVTGTIPGYAAHRSGQLFVNDILEAVDEVDVSALDLEEIKRLTVGPQNTVCALTVRRADKQLHLHLVRQAAVMD